MTLEKKSAKKDVEKLVVSESASSLEFNDIYFADYSSSFEKIHKKPKGVTSPMS